MSHKNNQGELTLRPWAAVRVTLVLLCAAVPAILVVVSVTTTGAGPVASGIIGAFVSLLSLPFLTYILSFKIVVTDTHVGQPTWFGRMRWAERARLAGLVRFQLRHANRTPDDTLLLLDGAGRPLLEINSPLLVPAHLDQLADHLRVPISKFDQPLTRRQLTQYHPGSMPFRERNRSRYISFAVMAILGAFFPLIMLWILLS